MSNKHIMLDIETLHTRPGGVVFQIGACRFSPLTGQTYEKFFVDICTTDSVALGLEIDGDTAEWWFNQGGIKQASPLPVLEAFTHFHRWITDIEPDFVWSHGIDFDFPMLEHIFRLLKIPTPWPYYIKRDSRTIWSLANPRARHSGASHDALEDCIQQVRELHDSLYKLDILID